MTSAGNNLYARLGSPITGVSRHRQLPLEQRGYLMGMDLSAQGRLLFKATLDEPRWGREWSFDGAPIVDGGDMYVALRQREDTRAQSYVGCFDAKSGGFKWLSPMIVGGATLSGGDRDELTHNLLAKSHDTIYFNTNLGVVAAIDARDGQILWLNRYPRASFLGGNPDENDLHFFRDLNPCVIHRGIVVAAPADCDRIFAIDAASGRIIWSTPPALAHDAMQVLGVAGDKLVLGGDYLYWLDVHSGRMLGQFPLPGRDADHGHGRGLLAGDKILWPTREMLYVFDQQTMRQTRQPINLMQMGVEGGNLLIADGVLLIAAADRLIAFNETGSPRKNTEDNSGP